MQSSSLPFPSRLIHQTHRSPVHREFSLQRPAYQRRTESFISSQSSVARSRPFIPDFIAVLSFRFSSTGGVDSGQIALSFQHEAPSWCHLQNMAQQNNRNSPHLSNHLQNGSAPSSPSMSNAQQGGAPSRQPASYPSPTSYPSPSLSNAQYNYPAPSGQQVNEPYRASPTGSNGSLPLPSMRSIDPLQQQQQGHHMSSPLPPPVAPMNQPYYQNSGHTLPHPSHQYPNVTSDPTGMRYALPHQDSRVMSGGRHKKVRRQRGRVIRSRVGLTRFVA